MRRLMTACHDMTLGIDWPVPCLFWFQYKGTTAVVTQRGRRAGHVDFVSNRNSGYGLEDAVARPPQACQESKGDVNTIIDIVVLVASSPRFLVTKITY